MQLLAARPTWNRAGPICASRTHVREALRTLVSHSRLLRALQERKGDREAGQARTCIRVFHTASLGVPSAVSACLWDIVSCLVNRMHDARLLALRHC
eukprot:4805837-Prymnesium_polylepis.1